MRRKWWFVTLHGQQNGFCFQTVTWSAAVMGVLQDRYPDGELDEWSRRLEPEGNLWQGIIRSPYSSASFAVSGECREATSAEMANHYQNIDRGAAA